MVDKTYNTPEQMNFFTENFNAEKWIASNFHWLVKWIERGVVYNDLIYKKSAIMTPIYVNVSHAVDIHKIEMLAHLLFSRQSIVVIDTMKFNRFDGFVSKFNRLPNENDNIRVSIATEKFFSIVGNMIISEIFPIYEIMKNTPEDSLISKSAAPSTGVSSGTSETKQ